MGQLAKTISKTLSVFSFLLLGTAFAFGPRPSAYYLAGFVNYSALNGYLQIPNGGQPGSSSANRPTLGELGIKNNYYFQLLDKTNWGRFSLIGNTEFNEQTKSSTLTQQLITHGITIPAGSFVSTFLKLDLFEIGSAYDFYFADDKLTLSPLIDLTVFDFGYHLSTGSLITRRDFNSLSIRTGVLANYNINKNLNWIFSGIFSVPFTNLFLATFSAKMAYKFYTYRNYSLSIVGGLGIKYLDFKDKQTLPNHIHVKEIPSAAIGIELNA